MHPMHPWRPDLASFLAGWAIAWAMPGGLAWAALALYKHIARRAFRAQRRGNASVRP
jgi:hypothetical protein